MKKAAIITLLVVVAVAIALVINNDRDSNNTSTTAVDTSVLNVQDKRLTQGRADAPVKIVEYADILCPYCAKANEDTIPNIRSNYIDTGKVQYEVRLVAMISPNSQRAAEGAYCAAKQDKFWDYTDTAYKDTWNDYYSKNKKPADVPLFTEINISSFATKVGLNGPKWEQCMDDDIYLDTITQNQKKMSELKAYGTPHFIINGENYNGAPPYSAFKAVIDAELNKQKANS